MIFTATPQLSADSSSSANLSHTSFFLCFAWINIANTCPYYTYGHGPFIQSRLWWAGEHISSTLNNLFTRKMQCHFIFIAQYFYKNIWDTKVWRLNSSVYHFCTKSNKILQNERRPPPNLPLIDWFPSSTEHFAHFVFCCSESLWSPPVLVLNTAHSYIPFSESSRCFRSERSSNNPVLMSGKET